MGIDMVRGKIAVDPAVASRILDEFKRKTPRSAEMAVAARRVMPGGDTRTVAFHAPYPMTVARGSGCHFTDVDGNDYLDCLNNYTSLIHGHAHPAIVAAVAEQLPRGTTFATSLESQTRLAAIVTDRVASVDLLRFTNSGTEATMNAIRAARAYTGRDVILKMEGGYHGTYDDVEVSVHPDPDLAGDADDPQPVIDARGVPRNTAENVLVTPFNDLDGARRVFARRGHEIAAVIVEPLLGSAGMIPAETDYVRGLRDLATEHGALLIFDEVMTFRLERGGLQQLHGVAPDLTAFAKIIGGGFPIGAFGGRAEIMEMFDPNSAAPLWQSGTFNGNAITMVAGIAAMEHFGADEIARINDLGGRLRAGLGSALADSAIPGVVTGYGSFVAVHFVDGPVRDYRDSAAGDQALKRLVHLALLLEGVFCAPRLMMCVSTPMTPGSIDRIVSAFARSIDRVAG